MDVSVVLVDYLADIKHLSAGSQTMVVPGLRDQYSPDSRQKRLEHTYYSCDPA